MASVDYGRLQPSDDDRSGIQKVAKELPADWTIKFIEDAITHVVIEDFSGAERGRGQFEYGHFPRATAYLEAFVAQVVKRG